MDGHMGLANAQALRLAGITPTTPDPYGGVIDRCPVTGQPTGILRDGAMQLVTSAVPDPSVAERRRAMEVAAQYCLQRVGGWKLGSQSC
jgi:predicted amidohydrolase YtcJ